MSSGGADGDSISGDDQGERSKISFFRLFSFAEEWDYFLMAVGSVGAFVHGASLPVFFIFFGKLLNEFAIASLSPAAVSHRVAKVRRKIMLHYQVLRHLVLYFLGLSNGYLHYLMVGVS